MPGMGLVPFSIDIDATGDGRYLVDGQDVTAQVAGAVVEIDRGNLTVLTLIQRASTARIEGQGIVQVQAPEDMLGQLAEVLLSADAAALEQKALNSPELGDGPGAVTRECLRLLAEQIRAGS